LLQKGEKAIDKAHPIVQHIKEWVDEEYENGRVTVITDDELVNMINALMIEKEINFLD
jgi:predicted ATP-dependent protease